MSEPYWALPPSMPGMRAAHPRDAMGRARTNEEWLRELRAQGWEQAQALEDLRAYLLRALPGALKSYGAIPEDLIEDVVQEALVRALDHLGSFEGRSRFTTWATTITARLAMTELRRRRWKDVSLEDISRGGELASLSASGRADDAETRTAQREVVQVMNRVIEEELSERQRTALVAELKGMPQEEIGRRLGTSRNAVYKLGHDARKKLKRGLVASGFDADEIRAAFS